MGGRVDFPNGDSEHMRADHGFEVGFQQSGVQGIYPWDDGPAGRCESL